MADVDEPGDSGSGNSGGGGPVVIAVTFEKGGTGKTFTTQNLAGGLAARGFNVLAIDGDKQASLTMNMGYQDVFEDKELLSYEQVLLDPEKWDQINDIIQTGHEEFDILPASETMRGNSTPLDSATGAERRLKKVLGKIEKDYHYVIIDCPPDVTSPYTKNAVVASEGRLVVPMNIEAESIYSLRTTKRTYKLLEQMHSDVEIRYLAYLLSYISNKQNIKEKQKVAERIRETVQPLFEIDDRAAFKRAKWDRGSIYTHKEAIENDQFIAFDEVVRAIVRQTNPPETNVDLERAVNMSSTELRGVLNG